ncbi:MAG: DUF1320 domain-containing protein [bacterium]|nr:DUF1320 domain-containing protein [bacterium]
MYLTIDEYLKRAYESETERLSNEDEVLDGTIGSEEEEILSICIMDASGTIDRSLRKRYRLPLDVVPEDMKRLAFQISRFYLHEKKNIIGDAILEIYDRAMAELKRIAKGDTLLDLPELSAEKAVNPIDYVKGEAKFSQANMSGY